jgi:hypothetical protein
MGPHFIGRLLAMPESLNNLEGTNSDKRSSLLRYVIIYVSKIFHTTELIMKIFFSPSSNNKLECLTFENIFRLLQYLYVLIKLTLQ